MRLIDWSSSTTGIVTPVARLFGPVGPLAEATAGLSSVRSGPSLTGITMGIQRLSPMRASDHAMHSSRYRQTDSRRVSTLTMHHGHCHPCSEVGSIRPAAL